jgi:hypothetical protein
MPLVLGDTLSVVFEAGNAGNILSQENSTPNTPVLAYIILIKIG